MVESVRYGGLAEDFSSYDRSRIVLLPVPFDKTTTYQQGTDKGPEALLRASQHMELYDIETETEVYRHGIYTAAPVCYFSSQDMVEKTCQQVSQYVQAGKFVVTLGGEHAISLGPIKAHSEHFGRISVLHLDAHFDLYPAYEANPYSHASVMARVKELSNIERVVSVGIRSAGIEELSYVDSEATFYAHTIYDTNKWIEKAISLLSEQVYISIDLDVFDGSLMPSTGTPEPGGLLWYQVLELLKEVAKTRSIVGFDCVELSPNSQNVAPDFLAAKLVYKLLSYRFMV